MADPGDLFSLSRGREAPADKDGDTYLRESRFSPLGKTRCWVRFGPCVCRVPRGGSCREQLVGLAGRVLLPLAAGKCVQRGAWLKEQTLHCGSTSVFVVSYALLEPRVLYLEFCSGAIFAKLELLYLGVWNK